MPCLTKQFFHDSRQGEFVEGSKRLPETIGRVFGAGFGKIELEHEMGKDMADLAFMETPVSLGWCLLERCFAIDRCCSPFTGG